MLVKQQVAKTAQDIFMGISSWNPVAKAHMMAYDKQLKDLSTMYDEEQIQQISSMTTVWDLAFMDVHLTIAKNTT